MVAPNVMRCRTGRLRSGSFSVRRQESGLSSQLICIPRGAMAKLESAWLSLLAAAAMRCSTT
jgi:hypothetical protein